ncbi:MAG TPA: hypothetical protein VGM80_16145 [Gaiellaceae bacterium]
MKQSREVQAILGGCALYIILSFFNWQEYDAGPFSVGRSAWHGIGLLAVLLAIVLLAWELSRALGFKVNTASLTPGQVSAGLALLLLVVTVITFLDWSDFRTWAEWVALILSIVIAGFAFVRAKAEGVTIPEMPKNMNMGSMGGSSTSTAAPPPPAAAPPAPAAPIDEPPPAAAPDATEA